MPVVCIGCGAKLQTEDEHGPGYVPAAALQRDRPLCRRCFRIRNYGEFSRVAIPAETYAKEVSQVLMKPGLVLYVLDVFDLGGSMVPHLDEYIGQSPVMAVVNKVDLLPKEVRTSALTSWIEGVLRHQGVKPVDVLLVSAETGVGMEELSNAIERRGERRAYAVGMANVGKSSVLNRWLQNHESEQPFTSSRVPGTTLGLSEVDVTLADGRRMHLIDTPGLMLSNRATDVLCADDLKVVVPSATLRPRIFQLESGQTLFLGGYGRLDFLAGSRQSIVCYVSNDLVIHRTKLERADSFADSHQNDILKSPCDACRKALGRVLTADIAVRPGTRDARWDAEHGKVTAGSAGCDIVLPGIGWITLTGSHFEGNLSWFSGMDLSVRQRLIGQINQPPERKVGIHGQRRKYT